MSEGKGEQAYCVIGAAVATVVTLAELISVGPTATREEEGNALFTGMIAGIFWPIALPPLLGLNLNRIRCWMLKRLH
jgi:hypothetical protein